jgi:hypothetical protein
VLCGTDSEDKGGSGQIMRRSGGLGGLRRINESRESLSGMSLALPMDGDVLKVAPAAATVE